MRQYAFTIGLALLCVGLNYELLTGSGDSLLRMLELDKELFFQGQVWRILSAHLVHMSAKHLWVDLAACFALGMFYEPELKRHWAGLFIACCLVISIVFLLAVPRLSYYRGLSGVGHGLFAAGMLVEYFYTPPRSWRRWLFYAVASGFVGKVVFEAITGRFLWGMSQDVSVMGEAIPEAHLAGMLTGGLYTIILLTRKPKLTPPLSSPAQQEEQA